MWDGRLEIVQYELLERDGDRFPLSRAAGGIHAGPGSAGSLIPPHEYHTIRNASSDAVAISLHIYQAPMENCAKFHPSGRRMVRARTLRHGHRQGGLSQPAPAILRVRAGMAESVDAADSKSPPLKRVGLVPPPAPIKSGESLGAVPEPVGTGPEAPTFLITLTAPKPTVHDERM